MAIERGTRLFIELFPPNPARHGIMRTYDESTGKKSVYSVSEKVTLALVESHLRVKGHAGRLGYMPGDDAGTTVGVIDIDNRAYGDAFSRIVNDVKQALSLAGITWYEETSTNGGSHIYVFSEDRVSYAQMYYFLRAFTNEAGHSELETFPSNATSGSASRWLLLPYAGALDDPEGLGRTWLVQRNGKPVPLNMLNNVVRNPSATLIMHATLFSEDVHQQQLQEAREDGTSIRDLDPHSAWEELRRAVLHPPESTAWHRHDAIIAFINLADRAARVGDMVELLKSEEVWRLWTRGDGSRTFEAWQDEVDRWHARWLEDADKLIPRHGIKHLLEGDWQLGRLKRVPSALLMTGVNLNKLPERELAELSVELLVEHGHHWAWDPTSVTAFMYDGKTWVPVQGHEEAIKRQLSALLGSRGKELREGKLNPVYRKMERDFLWRELWKQIDHKYVACENGLLNLETLELESHSPVVNTVGRVRANWEPGVDETSGAWQEFLAGAFRGHPHAQQFIDIFQEYAGYALTRQIRMRAMLELHGPSSTGKTTAWKVLLGVLGDITVEDRSSGALGLSTEQDVFDGQDWGEHFVGPTLVVFDELNTGDSRTGRKIITNLKRIAGGGGLYVNPKGRASRMVGSTAKLLLCTNFDLRLREDAANDAMFRRLVRLPFDNVVKASDEMGMWDQVILGHPKERERVFKWAVMGLRRLQEQGWKLSHTDLRQAQMNDSRASGNPVIQFLEERCVLDPRWQTTAKDLRAEFQAWAIENGYGKNFGDVTPQAFGARLKAALAALEWHEKVEAVRASKGVDAMYRGLMLKETS